MAQKSIYEDIAVRTGGDIYIGVVGPARSGKSTFIRKAMETAVIPNIENPYERERTTDALPQSGSGRTITTVEPKFTPEDGVKCRLSNTEVSVKLIDCVGFPVEGALGVSEDGEERLVKTPWQDAPMPLSDAAEIGTKKVITDHSTVAVLVSTDGTVCDLPRENYVDAEEKTVAELKASKKPFCMVLNSATPEKKETQDLAASLEEKYGVPVALVSCVSLDAEDVGQILGLILGEFPLTSLRFRYPKWVRLLPKHHEIKKQISEAASAIAEAVRSLSDLEKVSADFPIVTDVKANAAQGTADLQIPLTKDDYYLAVSELCEEEICDEEGMLTQMMKMAKMKKEFSKYESALKDVNEKGYGIVLPSPEELEFEEPRLVKAGNGYGVKMSANAESVHLFKAKVKAELNPMIGTQEQSEEMLRYLQSEMEEDPRQVWKTSMFGKSLYDLFGDGLQTKLLNIPDDSREKLCETLEKIMNEGANGLICILL